MLKHANKSLRLHVKSFVSATVLLSALGSGCKSAPPIDSPVSSTAGGHSSHIEDRTDNGSLSENCIPASHCDSFYGYNPSNDNLYKNIADYAEKKKAVLFGESHSKGSDNEEFMRLLPFLKERGYTHVALEIPEKYESLLKDEKGREKLNGMIKESYWNDQSNGDFSSGLCSIIDTSSQLGFNLAFIDPNYDVRGVKAYMSYYTLPAILENKTLLKKLSLREKRMAENVTRIIDKGGKVALFIGAGHVQAFSAEVDRLTLVEQPIIRLMLGGKTVAELLVEKYGEESIGLITLAAHYPTTFKGSSTSKELIEFHDPGLCIVNGKAIGVVCPPRTLGQ